MKLPLVTLALAQCAAACAVFQARYRRELAEGSIPPEAARADMENALALLATLYPPDEQLPPDSPIPLARQLAARFTPGALGPRPAP
jgi:hypothetical protein